MTPEEMTAAYSAAKKQEADDLKQFGYVTTSTKNALKDAEAGIRDYTQNVKESLNSLKGSLWKTVGSMAEGAKGASQYNDAISQGADYLSNYLSGKGPFAAAAAAIIKAGSMYVTAVNKQADALYKSYQDISRAGATGAGGVTELYANMQKFGYGIAELGELSALLKENSQSLAAMSGTVLDGTQTFGNISRGIRDSEVGDRFLNLGISVDQMNKGIAGYLRIQTLTGQAQLQTQGELQRGAEEYILQQERLTKLTGLNADEQNKILEQAKSEQEFGAYSLEMEQKIADAKARGDEESAAKIRAELKKNETINAELVSKGATEAAHGFRRLVTGYYNDPATKKFIQTLPNAAKAIRQNADLATTMNTMASDAEKNNRGTLELRKMGAAENNFLRLTENQAISGLQNYQERLDSADDQTKPIDKSTENLTELGKAQRKTRDDMQNLLQVGIRPVTALMGGLATAISKVSGGASAVATGVTGGAGGTGGKNVTTPTGNQASAAAGGALQGKSLAGIDSRLADAISSAAGEYKALTGRPVTVTSGVRTKEEQAKLYRDAQSGRSSFPAAPPGNSLHESGMAIDVSRSDAEGMDRAGLLSKYGLSRPVPGDPVHIQGGYRTGGIAVGPQSGYQATLHGTEAVVPLPDGKSIPVEMPNIMNVLSEETTLIAQQLSKMDDIMRVMQNQISVSNKILQRSQ